VDVPSPINIAEDEEGTVTAMDPKTHRNDVYEGVPLNVLVSDLAYRRAEVYRRSFAFRDTEAVSSADLDMHSAVVVADSRDGKRLGSDRPFCFIAKDNLGGPVLVQHVSYIRLSRAP
jgi:hypothetical protein